MLERLEAVLKHLEEHGIKLKPSKGKLFQTKLTYLGHVVSEAGVEPDPDEDFGITEMGTKSTENSEGAANFPGFRRLLSALC